MGCLEQLILFVELQRRKQNANEIMSKDYEEKTLLDNLEKLSVVSIGPFTSDELKKFQIKNIVAEVHTVAGAFDSMKSTLTVA